MNDGGNAYAFDKTFVTTLDSRSKGVSDVLCLWHVWACVGMCWVDLGTQKGHVYFETPNPSTDAKRERSNSTLMRRRRPARLAFRAGTLTNPYEEREKDLRPTASGTIGDPGTGRMFCGQADPNCSDREPRTPVSRETNSTGTAVRTCVYYTHLY